MSRAGECPERETGQAAPGSPRGSSSLSAVGPPAPDTQVGSGGPGFRDVSAPGSPVYRRLCWATCLQRLFPIEDRAGRQGTQLSGWHVGHGSGLWLLLATPQSPFQTEAVKVWSFTRLTHWEPGCQAVTNGWPHQSPGPAGQRPRAPSTQLRKRPCVLGPGPPLAGLGCFARLAPWTPLRIQLLTQELATGPPSLRRWPPVPTASGFVEAPGKRMLAFASLHDFRCSSLGLGWGEWGALRGAPSGPLHPLPPVPACSWPHPAGVPAVGGPHGSHLGSV